MGARYPNLNCCSELKYRNGKALTGTAQNALLSTRHNGGQVAKEKNMILLITASARGPECAANLFAETTQETHWARSLQQAVTLLREQAYAVVVIDQFLLETEPEDSDQMIEHLGTAYPVYINFGVTGMDRLLREVRSALHRRRREESAALRAVAEQLNSEMRESLTAMLLSCELAMAVPDVPRPAAEKIEAIDNLARAMRLRLEVN